MTEGKTRRKVHVSDNVPRRGRPELWAYGYADLAELFGVSVSTVQKMRERGFDFGNLEAICVEWLKRNVGRMVDRGEL